MMRIFLRLFLLVSVILSANALAAIDTYEFADEQTRQRFYKLNDELRCPKCQNQSLGDSNSPIATDLRREVYRLLSEGKSDREIKDFLVARYGEYILYRPEVSGHTLMLWFAPLGLLVIGLGVVLVLVKRRRSASIVDSSLGADEQAQLDSLLKEAHMADKKEPEARD